MANVVDFSQLRQKVTPWGEILDPITEEMQRRNADAEKERMQTLRDAPEVAREKRRVDMETERERHNRAVETQNTNRAVGKATVEEGNRQSTTEQKIRDEIGKNNNLDAAEQIGSSYQSFDPLTGAVSKGLPGFKIDRGIDPGMPSAEPANDASLDDVLADNSKANVTDPAQDAAVKEFQRKQSHPDIMIAGVHTTPDALRYSASRAAAADMGKVEDTLRTQLASATAMHDTATISAIQGQLRDLQVRRSQVENNLVKPDQAIKSNNAVTGAATKQGGAETIQDMRGKSAADVARINAQGKVDAAAAGVGAREASKAKDRSEGLDPKTYARVQADLSTFDRQHNISKDRADESRMATLLNNKDVTIVQRAMAGNLARGIGAERGVLTDKDISRLQGNLGGYWNDVENWLSKGATGDLSDDVKAKLTEGIQVVLSEKQKDRLAAEKAYERFFKPSYPGQRWGYGDDITNAFEEKFGHPYQPQAAPTGRVPVDPTNLDDANGPHANDPLDPSEAPPPRRKITREDALRMLKERGEIP